ncbi:hypothetical protein PR001_g9994 [Phytophthora rubi]|uniref:Uncharacterized protein n=1 Tax=Phytophthora rubi TaxID=129364 RepID=A0A6A3MQJ1_9STRA|nr:hypothetical protein PF003_g32849 [Phytophthora fragariae]KAE9033833.1 hypothetical protein PR001_g9994 [Phytophthora rubi]
MEVDGAMLLSMAFSPRALEDDPQWRDVPDVVRSSFLLVATAAPPGACKSSASLRCASRRRTRRSLDAGS